MNEGQLLLLWPGEVRRKREGDFGQIGPALLAGTNNRPSFINKIPSTSYYLGIGFKKAHAKAFTSCAFVQNFPKFLQSVFLY